MLWQNYEIKTHNRFKNHFPTPYTTLPHNLIEEKLTELIEQTFNSRAHLIWWSTQSRLATLLSSLIARRWVGLQTL